MRAARSPRDYYRISVLVFCVASHAVAMAQFALAFPVFQVPDRWYGQFAFLLIVSLAAGTAQILLAKDLPARIVLLSVRVLALVLATYPLGAQVTIRVTLLTALVFEAMMYLEPPASVLVSLAVVILTVAVQRPVQAWEDQTERVSLDSLLFLAFYPLVVMVLGALLRQSQRMAAERKRLLDRLRRASTSLVQTNLSLQEHILTAEDHARLLERQRISRELHDTTGYTLMNIVAMMKASMELSKTDIPRLRDFLTQTVEQAQRGLQETRAALRAMRDPGGRRPSIIQSVTRLVSAFQGTHIRVEAIYSGVPWSLGEEVDAAVYRLVQEGIANAIRHGDATSITVHLSLDGDRVNVIVDDNGVGAHEAEVGIGLTGIRERLGELGGELEAGNTSEGFRLHARIPHAGGPGGA